MSAVHDNNHAFLPKEVKHGCPKLGTHYEPTLTDDAVDTFYFIQAIPIPSYLIAVVSAKLARREISDRCAIWAEPSLVETAANEFSDTEIMLKTAEDLMGEYRWGRYDVSSRNYSVQLIMNTFSLLFCHHLSHSAEWRTPGIFKTLGISLQLIISASLSSLPQ